MQHIAPAPTPHLSPSVARGSSAQPGGFALLTTLLFLVVLTVLAIRMFSSSGNQGKISGNTLERQRAFQSAEYALRYGEWLLQQGNMSTIVCSTLLDLSVASNKPVVCSNALQNPTTVPWPAGMTFRPNSMVVAVGGGAAPGSTSGAPSTADVNYASWPMLYIQSIGNDANGNPLFKITAAGYGGRSSTVSVQQTVVTISQ